MQVQPSQVSPGENFDVFYFLRNHTDATTYYVQAKVYDVRTGELLNTITLSQSATNSRLFIATTQAPGDPVGYGRNIVSIATVYTDSSFSTKSENYEEQEQYFLVKSQLPFVGGGGGLDYGVLREIVQEEIEKAVKVIPKPEKLNVPDAPDMSFVDALFGALGAITREINRIPKDGPDLSKLADQILDVQELVKARPKYEPTDLSPILDLCRDIIAGLKELGADGKSRDANLIQSLESALAKYQTETTSAITAAVEETIHNQEITLPVAMKVNRPKKEVAPEQIDPTAAIRHLMS